MTSLEDEGRRLNKIMPENKTALQASAEWSSNR